MKQHIEIFKGRRETVVNHFTYKEDKDGHPFVPLNDVVDDLLYRLVFLKDLKCSDDKKRRILCDGLEESVEDLKKSLFVEEEVEEVEEVKSVKRPLTVSNSNPLPVDNNNKKRRLDVIEDKCKQGNEPSIVPTSVNIPWNLDSFKDNTTLPVKPIPPLNTTPTPLSISSNSSTTITTTSATKPTSILSTLYSLQRGDDNTRPLTRNGSTRAVCSYRKPLNRVTPVPVSDLNKPFIQNGYRNTLANTLNTRGNHNISNAFHQPQQFIQPTGPVLIPINCTMYSHTPERCDHVRDQGPWCLSNEICITMVGPITLRIKPDFSNVYNALKDAFFVERTEYIFCYLFVEIDVVGKTEHDLRKQYLKYNDHNTDSTLELMISYQFPGPRGGPRLKSMETRQFIILCHPKEKIV